MRALVLAQGTGRRWDDAEGRPYLGAPKHLAVRVDGEPVLARTVRLLRAAGVTDVVVVGPDDDRYRTDGARLVTLDDTDPCGCDMSKFVATAPLWVTDDRTVLLWGDCYYSDDLIRSVVNHVDGDYHVWRRPGASSVTGHRWDESFAVSFGPAEHARVLEVAWQVAAMVRHRTIRSSHIRTHLAAWAGLARVDDVAAVAKVGHQTHIDDWTDDFDRPDEWAGWFGRYYAGAYRVAVVVPWCGGDAHRSRAWRFVQQHYADMGVPVVAAGDPSGGRWVNRSAARNAATAAALEQHPDVEVLFLADADTFVPAHQMWAAVHLAHERQQLVLAFTDYLRSRSPATTRVLRGRRHVDVEHTLARSALRATGHASGAMAVPVDVWHMVGGYDERFLSWGGEDRAFWCACNTLAGACDRIHGNAYHLWHPISPERDERMPQYQFNRALGHRYKRAAGWLRGGGMLGALADADVAPDPDAMRALLAEPGGPLARQMEMTNT